MSFSVFLRLLCLTGLAACSLAVAVARCAPREAEFCLRTNPRYAAVNGSFFRPARSGAQVVDTATGALTPLPAPQAETLLWPAFSCWSDIRGERQVVGLWVVSHGFSANRLLDKAGLARLSYPSGRMLDRITGCPIPRRAPCWYPGPKPRILYGATDGRLYECAFGNAEQPSVRAVPWTVRTDCDRHPHVESVIWPDAPVLKGGLIAVVNVQESADERGPYRFWWIKLNPDGTAVAAASPMRLSEPDEDASANWHAPSVQCTPQGDCFIAWLSFPHGSRVAKLVTAPLRTDARTGEPVIVVSKLRKVANGLLGTPPAFSPDTRWLYAVQELPGDGPAVRRFSLGEPSSRRAARKPAGAGPPSPKRGSELAAIRNADPQDVGANSTPLR